MEAPKNQNLEVRSLLNTKQSRTFEITESVNTDRTVKLSFSSEYPYQRSWGLEVLDHSPGCCDLSFAKQGAAVIVNHDPNQLVGVVREIEIGSDLRGHAVVQFSDSSDLANTVYDEIVKKIRKFVSVGYEILEAEQSTRDGQSIVLITKWRPYEITIATIPADPTVGINRSAELTGKKVNMEPTVTDPPAAPAVDHVKILNEIRSKEETRLKQIRDIAVKHNCEDIASDAIRSGKSIEDFTALILETRYNAKPIDLPTKDPVIGMSKKDLKRFSVMRSVQNQIAALTGGRVIRSLETEASEAVEKLCGRSAKGIFLPHEVLNEERALSATGGGPTGGNVIATDLLMNNMIEFYRNHIVTAKLGAKRLSNLVGNIAIPRQNGASTAYWVAEGAAPTASNVTFDQVTATPHILSAYTIFSKQFAAQTDLSVENFVRSDLMLQLAIGVDLATIAGTGTSNQPTGILNCAQTPGPYTFAFGGAATFQALVNMETQLALSNADLGQLGYLIDPATRGKLKTAAKIGTTFPVFIYENDKINDYPVATSNQVPGHQVIFGNWNNVIQCDWMGMDLVVDPYTLATTGQIKLTILTMQDVIIRHGQSFAFSTDSGAQ